MDAARAAGARGGTVLHGKGTGDEQADRSSITSPSPRRRKWCLSWPGADRRRRSCAPF
ncbi:MAG: hypothetical protein ACLUNQ_09645 [Oscillospiraceae bacterium]